MASTPPNSTGSRETLYAILGSFAISVVVATLMTGNPLRSLALAYLDYSHTPAGGAAKASTTRAPATDGAAAPPAK